MKHKKAMVTVILLLVLASLTACAGSPSLTPTPTPSAKPTATATTTSTAAAKPASSPTSAVSFAGKTVTIIVPSAAGGGSDIVARVYARFLPRFLPGRPAVIVRNMPGGDATIGGNFAYMSKPDGLTVFASIIGGQMAQLLGVSAVKYDLLKMTLLFGTPQGGVYLLKTGIISNVEDLPKAKGLIFGTGPNTSSGSILFVIAKEALNIPTDKVVLAYTGAGEHTRAFLSGEVNFAYQGTAGYVENIAQYVAKGQVMTLFQSGVLDDKGNIVKDQALPPNVPTGPELFEKLNGKPPSGMPWEAYRAVVAAGLNYNRTLLLPPGAPDAIVRTYWDATAAMLKDAEFHTVIDPLVGKDTSWGHGEAYDKGFKVNFAIKPEVRDWMRAAMKNYGVVID